MERQPISKVDDEVVSICPETDRYGSTSEDQDPNWHRRLRRGFTSVPVALVSGGHYTSIEQKYQIRYIADRGPIAFDTSLAP
jgi:hypothetical protein